MRRISQAAKDYQSTLKRAEQELLALVSHHPAELESLFRSMTPGRRKLFSLDDLSLGFCKSS